MLIASIIIVNYNGESFLSNCFQSLEKQTMTDFEVILVDNASTDRSLEVINQTRDNVYPFSLKVILLDKNKGFAGGNIEGLQYTTGMFIALLNPDTEVEPLWIEELIKAMKTHSEVGICASKLITHTTNLIDSAGDGFATILKGYKRGEGKPAEEFNMSEFVFGACAGACLYRREMINEIGFLDEDFFLIHEDTDLNLRAQLAGWKCIYVPSAVVYHHVHASIGNMSDISIYYNLRNCDFVKIKNISLIVFIRNIIPILFSMVTEFFYFAIKHKKLFLYLKAKKEVISSFSTYYKKRKDIFKIKSVSDSYLQGLLTPIYEKGFFMSKVKKLLCQ